jgi:hypothetical protein
VSGDPLLKELNNKTEMSTTIKEVKLSGSTLSIRVDTEQELKQDFEICEVLKLHLDGSTYVCDVSGLVDFILIFFSIEKELSSTEPSHGNSRNDYIFESLYASLLEMKVPIHNLELLTTDNTPIMTVENGLIRLRKHFSHSRICIVTNVSFISKICVKVIDF